MSKFSVRFTEVEDHILAELQSRWQVDRSKAVRQAVRLADRPRPPHEGWFTVGRHQLPIRLKGKDRGA